MSEEMIHLDGTTLEGGGQLLRLALSLSSLTYMPIHVTDIRGRRGPLSSPNEGGGLKSSHLAAVKWLAHVTDSTMAGAEVKSRELTFKPSKRSADAHSIIATAATTALAKKRQNAGEISWQDRYDGEKLIRKESKIPASTPGSIFLVLQALLPYILFSDPLNEATSQAASGEQVKPVCHRLIVEGGTNVSKSPSFEYVDQVLLPMLCKKVGIPPIRMKMDKRGWTHGRAEVGQVTFDITPLSLASTLPCFTFTGRGEVTRFVVSILAPDLASRQSIRQKVLGKILRRYPEVDIDFPVDEDSRHAKRLYLHVMAETSKGFRLGRDWMFDRKATASTAEQKNEQLVGKVLHDLEEELAHGGCVDEYMQDQLVVFQALAEGRSEVDYGKGRTASLHTQTAKWVAEQILGMNFDERGICEGQAFRVGEKFWERSGKGKEALVEDIKEFHVSDEAQ